MSNQYKDPEYQRKYRLAHKEKQAAYAKQYYVEHPERFPNYRLKYPWYGSYNMAKYRCENPKHIAYPRYGGRGIKFLLSKAEVAKLWFRDKAYLMQRPTIDRLNNDGNYTFDNCQFIPGSVNSKKGNK